MSPFLLSESNFTQIFVDNTPNTEHYAEPEAPNTEQRPIQFNAEKEVTLVNTCAKNIYEYIESKGITQQKIADLLGLGWNATHAKLTGERPFTLSEAIILADFIDCSLDWLVGRNRD